MGKGQSKEQQPVAAANTATATTEAKKDERLNTGDLKKAISFAATRGKTTDGATAADFLFIFELKARAYGLLAQNEHLRALASSDIGKMTEEELIKAFDMDGDGKITPRDFEIMFEKNMNFLDKHQETINTYLPFAGQCGFGITAGWAVGRLAKSLYAYKLPITLAGACTYSAAQYLAQQEYVNKQIMEDAFKTKMKNMADINNDGVINKQDLEQLIDNKMEIVSRKLGPGGFAPGMAGYATFGLGMAKGLRVF